MRRLPEAEKDGEMLKVGRMAKPGLLTWNPKIDGLGRCSFRFSKGAFLKFQPLFFFFLGGYIDFFWGTNTIWRAEIDHVYGYVHLGQF